MAAGAWKFYLSFREKLGESTGPNLSGEVFKVQLHTSAHTINTALSTSGSLAQEVSNANGYTTGGKALTGRAWVSVATDKYRWSSSDIFWSANGGSITNIKYAIIRNSVSASGGNLVCYSTLSANAFSVTDTNRLTIQMNASGIFEMS